MPVASEEASPPSRISRRSGDALGSLVLAWYRQYTDLYRRLSKRPPGLVDLFCGGGGCSEGARRAGFSVHGVDVEEQPDFVRRFGDDAFTLSDALLPDEVRRACARVSAIGLGASPPCKSYATTVMPASTPAGAGTTKKASRPISSFI